MNNNLANRMNMFIATTALLALDEHKPVWLNQKPVLFTTTAASLSTAVEALQVRIGQQQASTLGHAADKQREEEELEDSCHRLGRALGAYFADTENQSESRVVSKSLSAWRAMRHAELIAQARNLCEKTAAAIASDGATLLTYGIDVADCLEVEKELQDFINISGAPSLATANRKAISNALRPEFAEVTAKLVRMDQLVLQFRQTPEAAHFAALWKNARIIRELGQAAAPVAA